MEKLAFYIFKNLFFYICLSKLFLSFSEANQITSGAIWGKGRTPLIMSKFGKWRVNFISPGLCVHTLMNASHLRDARNRAPLFSARPFPCRCTYTYRLSSTTIKGRRQLCNLNAKARETELDTAAAVSARTAITDTRRGKIKESPRIASTCTFAFRWRFFLPTDKIRAFADHWDS